MNEHDEGHVGGLLLIAPDYFAANKALSILRNEKSSIPSFAVVEAEIGLAKSSDKVWLPMDLDKPNVSARDVYYAFAKAGTSVPYKDSK